jgi:hypothetical protein
MQVPLQGGGGEGRPPILGLLEIDVDHGLPTAEGIQTGALIGLQLEHLEIPQLRR